MKKRVYELLCLLVLALFTLSLCSCGGKNDAAQDNLSENAGNKVILVLIDGMRPDGFEQCKNEYTEELKKNSFYTLNARTVSPPITLPAHLSLFYGVSPEVHGTMINSFMSHDYVGKGLFETLDSSRRKSCFYYNWEQLRDITRPGAVTSSEYIRIGDVDDADAAVTERALTGIKEMKPDFAFIYMGMTDSAGHTYGWMSEDYLKTLNVAIANVKKIIDAAKDEYTVILTADHGGHKNEHGLDIDDDMIIPMFIVNKDLGSGQIKGDVSILDVAPTVLDLLDIKKPDAWEGSSLIGKINKK